MNNNISDKDKIDWQNFLQSKERLQDKDNQNKSFEKSKINSIDLHGNSLVDANKIVENFINKSYEEGFKKLIIVTGKGIHSNNEKNPYVSKDFAILKYSVPEFIKNNNELMKKINDIREADIKDGGGGAFYVYLKKN